MTASLGLPLVMPPFERVFHIIGFLVLSRSDRGYPTQRFLPQSLGCDPGGFIGDGFCAHLKAYTVIDI
jgi:hypothetical protein